jgi:hypothetical protein
MPFSLVSLCAGCSVAQCVRLFCFLFLGVGLHAVVTVSLLP